MSSPRYRHAHQQERKRWVPVVEAGQAWCMQADPDDPTETPGSGCVMPTRWIHPLAAWQLAHNRAGTVTFGPAHRRCNLRDAAVRGNRKRARRARRWVIAG